MKKLLSLTVSVLLVFGLCYGCGLKVKDISPFDAPRIEPTDSSSAEFISRDAAFSDRELNGNWEDETATHITLGDNIRTDGEGASASGSLLQIYSGGTYVLSGSMNGRVVVETGKDEKLQLVLNGVSITSSDGPAIWIKKADKVFLTIAEGTQNDLSDSDSYSLDDEKPNAALYSKEDLSINGGGNLLIRGNYKHGVVSKDDLVIVDATLQLNAPGDGLRAKDCIKLKDATLKLQASGDGIQATSTEDATTGYVLISGGSYTIDAGCDGIQAASSLSVTGGDFSIRTGGGCANASYATSGKAMTQNAAWGHWSTAESSAENTQAQSAKGLKAGSSLQLQGGSFELDTSDDAIHADGDITLAPLAVRIQSGDDGIHAGGALNILSGSISIEKSYEGVEGNTLTVRGGSLEINAQDDGINVAGGADGSSVCERPGADSFQSGKSAALHIRGGTIHVNAMGDGLDSNGDLYISGGTITVSGPEDEANSIIDFDGQCEISGGTFAGAGSKGNKIQIFAESSAQPSIVVSYTQKQSAGTGSFLQDGTGSVLVGFAPEKDYSMVIFSAPALKRGESYALCNDGGMLADLLLSSSVSAVNEKGEAVDLGKGSSAPMGTPPADMEAPNSKK